MKIIALCGFKQSGKSTAFGLIKNNCEAFGEITKEVSFANRLKEVCSDVFNIPRDHFDDQSKKEVLFSKQKTLTLVEVDRILEMYGMYDKVAPLKIDSFLESFRSIELKTPRAIAQIVGTEVLRKLKSDIHCETLRDIMHSQSGEVDVFVITDCRFENELNYFKNEPNFTSFFIHRLSAYESFIRELSLGQSHPSEIETLSLIPKCVILNNNQDFDFLRKEITEKVR